MRAEKRYREKWKSITNTSNVSPLKFTHIYLLHLKRLKTGRRRNIWTKDRGKLEVVDEG